MFRLFFDHENCKKKYMLYFFGQHCSILFILLVCLNILIFHYKLENKVMLSQAKLNHSYVNDLNKNYSRTDMIHFTYLKHLF